MPSFDFSFTKKKVGKRKTSKSSSGFEIVLKEVEGVVWCNTDAIHYVDINDGFMYPIHHSCYSCKGHARVYRHNVSFEDRYIYIRSVGGYNECNPNIYLPFAPGCIVLGDLVKTINTDNHFFIIKKCWMDYDNTKSHEAIMFYKKHIDKINDIIRKKMYNGTQ